MQDPTLESMLAGSTPRQYSLAAGGLPSPITAAAGQLHPAGGPLARQHAAGLLGCGPAGAPPLLTYPSLSPELSGGLDEAGEQGGPPSRGCGVRRSALEQQLTLAACGLSCSEAELPCPCASKVEP